MQFEHTLKIYILKNIHFKFLLKIITVELEIAEIEYFKKILNETFCLLSMTALESLLALKLQKQNFMMLCHSSQSQHLKKIGGVNR